MTFEVRPFQPGDAAAVDDLWRQAFSGFEEGLATVEEALAKGDALLAATGRTVLVASGAGTSCAGAVIAWDDEGIGWFDLLVAGRPFAGRPLVKEVERWAQVRGLRTLRAQIPPDPGLLAYFSFLGYREIAAAPGGGSILERRLPLLTVREQRREDAARIGELAGVDPWPFEQGARPGWFVLADGARVVGVVSVAETGFGEAAINVLVLETLYQRRGVETWMLGRAGTWARTNGYHTVTVPAALVANLAERDLEDAGWFPEGTRFVLRGPAPGEV
jgi:hypothetical protein